MKTRSLFRRIALVLMAAMVMVTLTSCGGDGQASGYNIMVASGYVDGEALESFGETLKQEIPELAGEGVNASFSSTILGSADSDPMMNMGALVGFDAKVAAGEITVAIFDKESAARSGPRTAFSCAPKAIIPCPASWSGWRKTGRPGCFKAMGENPCTPGPTARAFWR